MTYNPQAGENGKRNKRVKSLVAELVAAYLHGQKTGDECMKELVKVAQS